MAEDKFEFPDKVEEALRIGTAARTRRSWKRFGSSVVLGKELGANRLRYPRPQDDYYLGQPFPKPKP